MRGIPKNIATKQDVLNLCDDLPVVDAQAVLSANPGFFSKEEYAAMKQSLTNKKRRETLSRNKEKRNISMRCDLIFEISSLQSRIDQEMNAIRELNRHHKKAGAEKDGLELVMQHVQGLENILQTETTSQPGRSQDWKALKENQDFLTEEEQKKLQRIIVAGKHKEKMEISGARRMWSRYHELCGLIPDFQAQIDIKTMAVKALLKEQTEKQKQKTELETSGRK